VERLRGQDVHEISVVIAERKKAVRASYGHLLKPERDILVIGEAGTKQEVIESLKQRPRILLLDWEILTVKGNPLLPLIKQYSPQTKVILLTKQISPRRILQALSEGARGYLERAFVHTSLVKAVRAVDGGETWVPRALVPLLLDMLSRITLP
jgi:DNA-binding NarL/FixJ family response regulator